jgi:pSer/pThr/pTyr-binding forkhead associated (FHA) protein
MTSKVDDSFDPAQPALIVTFGSTNRKHRALVRTATVLGKASGCDVGLVAPDVSHVHCLIVRSPEGFRLRDCASRTGTRLNGDMVTEAMLRDGDILQVGPFSFRLYLPPHLAPAPVSAGPAPEGTALESTQGALVHRQAELDRQAAILRERSREYDQRLHQLEQAERDLACDRETLDQEFAALHVRLQQVEQEVSRRQTEVESDLRTRWEELQTRLRREEEQRRAEQEQARPADGEWARRLEIRQRELDHFAEHLQRTRRQLHQQAESLRQTRQQLDLTLEERVWTRGPRAEGREKWPVEKLTVD